MLHFSILNLISGIDFCNMLHFFSLESGFKDDFCDRSFLLKRIMTTEADASVLQSGGKEKRSTGLLSHAAVLFMLLFGVM